MEFLVQVGRCRQRPPPAFCGEQRRQRVDRLPDGRACGRDPATARAASTRSILDAGEALLDQVPAAAHLL